MAGALFLLACILIFVLIGIILDLITPKPGPPKRYGIEEDSAGTDSDGSS